MYYVILADEMIDILQHPGQCENTLSPIVGKGATQQEARAASVQELNDTVGLQSGITCADWTEFMNMHDGWNIRVVEIFAP